MKDSISAHGMNNTAGSLRLVGSKTYKEASVITQLRKAGAIILRKPNMPQWGNSRSSPKSSNGWSAWGGQTLGRFYPNQDPCGSSSGSAVAMSPDLAAFMVGVEVKNFIHQIFLPRNFFLCWNAALTWLGNIIDSRKFDLPCVVKQERKKETRSGVGPTFAARRASIKAPSVSLPTSSPRKA